MLVTPLALSLDVVRSSREVFENPINENDRFLSNLGDDLTGTSFFGVKALDFIFLETSVDVNRLWREKRFRLRGDTRMVDSLRLLIVSFECVVVVALLRSVVFSSEGTGSASKSSFFFGVSGWIAEVNDLVRTSGHDLAFSP